MCLATIHTISMHTVSVSMYTQTYLRAHMHVCAHTHTETHTHSHTNVYIHMQVRIAIKQHFGYEPLSLPCLKGFEEHFQDLQRIWWRTASTFLWCSSCCQKVYTLWALIAALDWAWIAETTEKIMKSNSFRWIMSVQRVQPLNVIQSAWPTPQCNMQ